VVFVIQQGDGTLTGPRFESFHIRGIPGLDGLSIYMDWWIRGLLCSAAAFRVRRHAGCLKFQCGCLTEHWVHGGWPYQLRMPIFLAGLLWKNCWPGTPSQGADLSGASISHEASRGEACLRSWGGCRTRGIALCPQQPRLATAHRDVPRRYRFDRPEAVYAPRQAMTGFFLG
jgi:hypothetical protein